MNTFLPYPDFDKSAQCLDNKRLGKQRVEAWQILELLLHPEIKSRWRNHPAVKMWEHHTIALCYYGLAMCVEWERRGYKNIIMKDRFLNIAIKFKDEELIYPPWFGDIDFHVSHISNLIRKKPKFYIEKFGDFPNNLPYLWPKLVIN